MICKLYEHFCLTNHHSRTRRPKTLNTSRRKFSAALLHKFDITLLWYYPRFFFLFSSNSEFCQWSDLEYIIPDPRPRHCYLYIACGSPLSVAMLQICDILVQIRIRGSVTLPNGSGSGLTPDPAIFIKWPSRQEKEINFSTFFSGLRIRIDSMRIRIRTRIQHFF